MEKLDSLFTANSRPAHARLDGITSLAFAMWMAGGGIKGENIIGATDEIGLRAVEDKCHMHDIDATMLSLLGLDHRKLTYLFQGRQFHPTDVDGDNDLAPGLIAW